MISQRETADQGGKTVGLKRFDHFRDSLRNDIFRYSKRNKNRIKVKGRVMSIFTTPGKALSKT
jgi:hypothetical protein